MVTIKKKMQHKEHYVVYLPTFWSIWPIELCISGARLFVVLLYMYKL